MITILTTWMLGMVARRIMGEVESELLESELRDQP
jgi:hypothetical protein